MKRLLTSLMILAAVFGSRGNAADTGVAELHLVPQPAKVEQSAGAFSLTAATPIYSDSKSQTTAGYLAQKLRRATGHQITPAKRWRTSSAIKTAILLTTSHARKDLGAEGYELTITPDSIEIRAPEQAGLFYGVQTLLQLLPPEIFSTNEVAAVAWTLPCVHIEDRPRFQWRGMMLDVSRHFFTVAEVKKFLDEMAVHKLNTFHWHLVDMDGWRIEIKKYPLLTRVGAWRKGVLFNLDPKSTTAYGPDGRYGGFYTQAEIRDVVAYAEKLHITIVPEIEMPGHSTEVMACYPELSCSGGKYSIDRVGKLHIGVFCAGNDASFDFLENVLTEVMPLFPSKYIHVGGDEVEKEDWKKCPKCQARIQHEGLKNEEDLQGYFMRRVAAFLATHGHTPIGWSEILQGGLATNAVVMDWIGGGLKSASSGHDVVMSPTEYCYFDYYQSTNHATEPRAIGRFLPLQKVYSFEPIPSGLAPEFQHHVLGAQGCLWTEFISSQSYLEYMTYPRGCALAEVVWSPKEARDWDGFSRRLQVHARRLEEAGINFRQASLTTNDATQIK